MALESTSCFSTMLKRLGLAHYASNLAALGADNAGNFAFVTNYVPGTSDDGAFLTEVVIPVLGSVDHPLKPALKRLHFECYHLVASEAQHKVEPSSEARPRKMPGAERADRLNTLRSRLSGIVIKGELEPSHCLVDKFWHMADTGAVKHIAWAALTKRESEIRG
eukprot:3135204-Karenia_brevis.AAC.1